MDKDSIKNPLIIIISSPSGAGTTSICKNLIKLDSNLRLSISVTTRQARDNEINHKDYHFVDSEEFNYLRNNDKFLEDRTPFANNLILYLSLASILGLIITKNKKFKIT